MEKSNKFILRMKRMNVKYNSDDTSIMEINILPKAINQLGLARMKSQAS